MIIVSSSLRTGKVAKQIRSFGLLTLLVCSNCIAATPQVSSKANLRNPSLSPSKRLRPHQQNKESQKNDEANTRALIQGIQDLKDTAERQNKTITDLRTALENNRADEGVKKRREEAPLLERIWNFLGASWQAAERRNLIVVIILAAIGVVLGLIVYSRLKGYPDENNTPTTVLFSPTIPPRRKGDWLSEKHTLPYLLKTVGRHAWIFVLVILITFTVFYIGRLDVAILSCIEIFFAFVGAYYASLADRSSLLAHKVSQDSYKHANLAYENANLTLRSVMNFSDDLGGFVERLKLLVTRLTGEGKDITMKFVTVIPAFGKVGLSLPEGESYYSRMKLQPRPVGEEYKTWHEFLENMLENNGKNGQGRVKVRMLAHGEEERKKWIKSIMIASRLAENDASPAITKEIDFQKDRLEKLKTFPLFECQEWKTPPRSNDNNGGGSASVGYNDTDNSMPFQFVVIRQDEASVPKTQTVNLGSPGRKIWALLIWMGISLGVTKALAVDNIAANTKRATAEKLSNLNQKRYDGSKLMFLFSGDYIYNNFLVDIEKCKNNQTEGIDLSMHEFVNFSKGYYSESGELIEFFDKLFEFLWNYSKTHSESQ